MSNRSGQRNRVALGFRAVWNSGRVFGFGRFLLFVRLGGQAVCFGVWVFVFLCLGPGFSIRGRGVELLMFDGKGISVKSGVERSTPRLMWLAFNRFPCDLFKRSFAGHQDLISGQIAAELHLKSRINWFQDNWFVGTAK